MALDFNMPVLVVDDYRTMVRIIRNFLNQLGFADVDGASDGGAALKMMHEKDYGLVISDWNMEPMTGYELLREVRADDHLSQTPFIVVGYIAALLGGLIAVAIGWYINTAKRTLPNGERVYVYRASDRRHAARIFSLGILIFLGWFALRLWSMFKS